MSAILGTCRWFRPGRFAKAEKDGDEWVINGQKIWTSGAHCSDTAALLFVPTPTCQSWGLSFFFIDMKSSDIEIKPIKQLTSGSDFNEVYFTDVRVPDSQRLGGRSGLASLITR